MKKLIMLLTLSLISFQASADRPIHKGIDYRFVKEIPPDSMLVEVIYKLPCWANERDTELVAHYSERENTVYLGVMLSHAILAGCKTTQNKAVTGVIKVTDRSIQLL